MNHLISSDVPNQTAIVNATLSGTTVRYTNTSSLPPPPGPPPPPQTGYVEVCKDTGGDGFGDSYVGKGRGYPVDPNNAGFIFTITDPDGHSTMTAPVQVGQCSDPVQVVANHGPVTVQETGMETGGNLASTFVTDADVNVFAGLPVGYRNSDSEVEPFSEDLGSRSVTATVTPGDLTVETRLTFNNELSSGQLKICETLAPGAGALVGTYFYFNYTDGTFSDTARVKAGPVGTTQCVLSDGPLNFEGWPTGDRVTVTEKGGLSYVVTSIVGAPNAVQFPFNVGGAGWLRRRCRRDHCAGNEHDHVHERGHRSGQAVQDRQEHQVQ